MSDPGIRSVLIVEDDKALCGYLASALTHAGYQSGSLTTPQKVGTPSKRVGFPVLYF